MSMVETPQRGLRVLSLDGIGPGVMCQMKIIDEITNRLAHDLRELGDNVDKVIPVNHFDVIGGVDFGAVAAALLGCFGMTVDEASEWLIEIGQALFPQKGEYDSTMSRLKGVLERMLEQKGLPIDIRLDDQHLRKTHCKVILLVSRPSHTTATQLFRNYSSRRNESSDCTFVDAISASISHPEWYPQGIHLSHSRQKQRYSTAAAGSNNPILEILDEFRLLDARGQPCSLILSLGTGRAALSVRGMNFAATLRRLVYRSDLLDMRLPYMLQPQLKGALIRLDVYREIHENEISDWTSPDSYGTVTDGWIRDPDVSARIDKVVEKLIPDKYQTQVASSVPESTNTTTNMKDIFLRYLLRGWMKFMIGLGLASIIYLILASFGITRPRTRQDAGLALQIAPSGAITKLQPESNAGAEINLIFDNFADIKGLFQAHSLCSWLDVMLKLNLRDIDSMPQDSKKSRLKRSTEILSELLKFQCQEQQREKARNEEMLAIHDAQIQRCKHPSKSLKPWIYKFQLLQCGVQRLRSPCFLSQYRLLLRLPPAENGVTPFDFIAF